MENQLVKVINESGLDKSKAQILLENFSNYFEIAADWESKAKVLIVTSEDQKAEMKMAREGRLFLKEKRIAVDKTRKALKESALREGQTIDAIAKVLTNLIIPIENDLEQKEKFVEIQEAKRKAELKSKREIEIQSYIEFIPFGIDLGSMDEESFQKLFNGAKLQLQQKLDAERKAEEERIAKEKAETEERERIRKENERLKSEAEAKEKQLAEEREKAEAERKKIEEAAKKEREEAERKLKAEQEAARIAAEKAAAEKAKLEAEIKAKAEAEEKARKEAEAKIIAEQKAKEAAEKKAKNATDKTKLIELKKRIDEFVLPEMNSDDGRHIVENVYGTLSTISYFLQTKISKL